MTELDALRSEIRAFVQAELAPHTERWESEGWFPDEVFARMAEAELLGLKYPVEYGGRGLGFAEDAVLTQELARSGSGGLSAGIGAHIGIATPPVFTFGTEDQRQRYLVPAIAGHKIAALAITEPGAGSDVAAIRTRAEQVDGGWVVNGSKMFITNGVRADFLVCAVKTTSAGGHHGLSFLIVDTDQPGVSASKIDKLGWHASDTALIALDDVFVPTEDLLGAENEGFKQIMANFQWERLIMALGAVAAMEEVLARAEALGDLSELHVTLEANRALTDHALRLFCAGRDATREVTMAKLSSQRAAYEVADACLQMGADVERAVRDLRLGPIGGGTDEIMSEILGRSLGL